MELANVKKIHCIGIGGVSMSSLAECMRGRGFEVSGCDITTGGHSVAHITKDIDLVVVSQAVSAKSPGAIEVEKARLLNIPVEPRAWLIGRLMQEKNKFGIAVAGTHGKSTVTAMLGKILVDAKSDPTILDGAVMQDVGASWRDGNGQYVLAEACEYEKQFLQFVPRAAIITNIDVEHLDSFPKGLPQIIRAFRDFVKLIPGNGLLVINSDDRNCIAVAKSARCKVKRVSGKDALPGVRLKVPGEHNFMNARLAAQLAHELGISHDVIKQSLNTFTGVARRIEKVGERNGVTVYDDYGHHPKELEAVIKTLRHMHQGSRLIVIFQPHQAHRTKLLFDDFVRVLKGAGVVVLAPIFVVAGRDDTMRITSGELAKAIGGEAIALNTYDEILEQLRRMTKPGDVVVTIGATKIDEVAKKFVR